MTRLLPLFAAAPLALLCAAPVLADAPTAPPPDVTVSGSVALASQYRFRGIAQSNNKPVIQGALTVAHASGFYVATWGSSASAGAGAVNIGGTEIDLYGGYSHALGRSGWTVDGGLYSYNYPGYPGGWDRGSYYEIYGSLAKALGPLGGKAGVNFAPAQKATRGAATRSNTYLYGELTLSPPRSPLTLHGHLGHTGGAFDYTKPFFDYTAGASYKWKALTFDLALVGTSVSRSDAARTPYPAPAPGGAPSAFETWRAAKPVAVASLTASF